MISSERFCGGAGIGFRYMYRFRQYSFSDLTKNEKINRSQEFNQFALHFW